MIAQKPKSWHNRNKHAHRRAKKWLASKLRAQDHQCFWCGRRIYDRRLFLRVDETPRESPREFSVNGVRYLRAAIDFIKELAVGGRCERDNVVVACQDCNQKRSAVISRELNRPFINHEKRRRREEIARAFPTFAELLSLQEFACYFCGDPLTKSWSREVHLLAFAGSTVICVAGKAACCPHCTKAYGQYITYRKSGGATTQDHRPYGRRQSI